jgi:thiamine-monophosphate kinase
VSGEGAGEFDLIGRHFAPLATDPAALGLLDDAAVLTPSPGHALVVTTDCMVESVHFLAADGPDAIARKLLRVNLSDLAAMGARPRGYFLGLALPRGTDEAWIAAFAAGLAADQQTFGITLLGGDTTASPDRLVLNITAMGEVPQGGELRRGGAHAGDDLWVSGTIGDATAGLAIKLRGLVIADSAYFLDRLHLPTPRLALGQGLRGLATAALDVSDGLLQDAGHIGTASRLAVIVEQSALPLSPQAAAVLPATDLATGGDDYELVFAAPPAARDAVLALGRALGVQVTRIGHLAAGQGVELRDDQGRAVPLARRGYQHF